LAAVEAKARPGGAGGSARLADHDKLFVGGHGRWAIVRSILNDRSSRRCDQSWRSRTGQRISQPVPAEATEARISIVAHSARHALDARWIFGEHPILYRLQPRPKRCDISSLFLKLIDDSKHTWVVELAAPREIECKEAESCDTRSELFLHAPDARLSLFDASGALSFEARAGSLPPVHITSSHDGTPTCNSACTFPSTEIASSTKPHQAYHSFVTHAYMWRDERQASKSNTVGAIHALAGAAIVDAGCVVRYC
jgi:hypothetical protein